MSNQEENEVNESSVEETQKESVSETNTELIEKDAQIDSLKAHVEEQKEKYLRLYADFENYKKRTEREKREFVLYAGKDILLELLPTIDDFERAIKANENSEDVQAIKEGMNLIYTKFLKTLESKGVKALSAVGEDFDVEKHEAITEIPAPNDDLAGKVIDEVQKGYSLHEKIIRFAKVIVGKKV